LSGVLINILQGVFGLIFFIAIAYLFSVNKKEVKWSLVARGLVLQIIIAVLLLKVPFFFEIFNYISGFFVMIFNFANKGAEFLFGKIATDNEMFGFIFALRVLPAIIFFSALSSLLYHWGILQKVVKVFAILMQKSLKITGAESLAASANIFLGHTEAPLVVRPYLANMTRSELHCLITGGLSTISGAVLAAAVGMLGGDSIERQQFFATQFLTASIISAPAAIVFSKILFPESEDITGKDKADIKIDKAVNMFDALANGAFDGLKLALNVATMLLVFVSLIALLNYLLSDVIGFHTGLNELIVSEKGLTLEYILGIIFAPIAWIMGISSDEIMQAGQLLGEKTVINEFYAYVSMEGLISSGALSNERNIIILTYALCGFANFGSIGIMIGAISALEPSRKTDVAKLVLRALLGGTLACFMTAVIAGLIFY